MINVSLSVISDRMIENYSNISIQKLRYGMFIKLFYCVTVSLLIFLSYISIKDIQSSQNKLVNDKSRSQKSVAINERAKDFKRQSFKSKSELKYILKWTNADNVPFVYMGEGQQGFIDRKCTFTNCYVTSNRTLLGDYIKFDVIAFAGPEVVYYSMAEMLPERRSPLQKFVFASIESSDNYPICTNGLDDYFNWTWTYKLDSDARWGYIVVRDIKKRVIGPNKIMHWLKLSDMKPVSDKLKEKLKTKKKAAAWFVSNCHTRSKREDFVMELQEVLKKYNLSIDIYGNCAQKKCFLNRRECGRMIATDYYFYLSFENSFAEDYVTEKILHGLQNNAVPIVFGGANYTRFMPDGIYLHAGELGVDRLAHKMFELIKNPDKYSEYFRWQNHYFYHRRIASEETNDYCRFCSMLNEERLVKAHTVYKNFRQWWTPPNRCASHVFIE